MKPSLISILAVLLCLGTACSTVDYERRTTSQQRTDKPWSMNVLFGLFRMDKGYDDVAKGYAGNALTDRELADFQAESIDVNDRTNRIAIGRATVTQRPDAISAIVDPFFQTLDSAIQAWVSTTPAGQLVTAGQTLNATQVNQLIEEAALDPNAPAGTLEQLQSWRDQLSTNQ